MAKKTFEQAASSGTDSGVIAQRAYEIWQREGCPDGRAMEHWFRAETELAGEHARVATASTGGKGRRQRPATSVEARQFQIAGR